MPDRSQASWPLGGAEVAGSGPVPSSPGQALCQARWVRLRAARWARPRAAPAGSGSVPSPLGVQGGALGTIAVSLPGCRCFALSSLGRVSFASGLHLA